MTSMPLYRPPAPVPKSTAGAMAAAFMGQRDMLGLLPEGAYEVFITRAPVGKRPIFIVNHPGMVRRILQTEVEHYPKSDLMVDALSPLVGDGIFISGGAQWVKQRQMIDPAFAHMRIKTAFGQMAAATDDAIARFDQIARDDEAMLLDEEMSYLTADIVFRTIFSRSIDGADARGIFRAFSDYQNAVPQINPKTLIGTRAWEKIDVPSEVRETCRLIREKLGHMIDRRIADGHEGNDIAGDLIAARDPDTGAGFSREDLIDQIAVFFLAGHETTASALTWTFFILSQRPEIMDRMRAEIDRKIGGEAISFAHTREISCTRNVFREALRLYPPVSFITRIAAEDRQIAAQAIPKGALMVISPWLIHRHRRFWNTPELFDPDRFSPTREREIMPGSYLPFGLGPRVCTGASFAATESALILAALCRRFEFETLNPRQVEPVGKLTTRPKVPISMRLRRR
ncbi:MAG: cytochrome P450 [Pseudomonadota bacterium]